MVHLSAPPSSNLELLLGWIAKARKTHTSALVTAPLAHLKWCPASVASSPVTRSDLFRLPGLQDAEVADFRMYVGQALNSTEIRQLAFAPQSPRSCVRIDEGLDSARFKDVHGRGCEWYEERRKSQLNICATKSVQVACPLACGLHQPCFAPASEPVPVHRLYTKVQRIRLKILSGVQNRHAFGDAGWDKPPGLGGVLCPMQDVDLGAQCRAGATLPSKHAWALQWQNTSDCDLVSRLSVP